MNRKVLSLTGSDRVEFLQGLVTNDITKAPIVYAALLTPQGKFLADFFVVTEADRLLIDVAEIQAARLAQRLRMYRLRADVQISETDIIVSRGLGPAPEGALMDPRHKALGWRLYGDEDRSEAVDWDAMRVELNVPEAGVELGPDSYILEAGFERLNGVDFKKGCFVGQEIVARMKHKSELRKGIVRVSIDGPAKVGDVIFATGKTVGTLHTISNGEALAFLRLDRVNGDLTAGDAKIKVIDT